MADSKELLIIDASVIVKWFFQQEVDADRALLIRNKHLNNEIELAIPSFAFYEVMNVISLKATDFALQFFSQLLLARMDEYSLTLSLTSLATKIVQKHHKVSFYDAAYHALAIKLGGTFVTADEKYFEKTKKLKHIALLLTCPD